MKTIEVCISPEMLPFFELKGKTIVVTDIFRATSCMVSALSNQVKEIIPVATIEECRALQNQGMLAAAERNGQKVQGFNMDNSPFSYLKPEVKGKSIAMTTTNGTKAIREAEKKKPYQILIGAFLNLETLANFLKKSIKSIVVLCAGWKNRVSLEDSLFAGALVEALNLEFEIKNDTAKLMFFAYENVKNNMQKVVENCEHAQRLTGLNMQEDIAFCLRKNVYQNIPILKGRRLIDLKTQ